MAERVGGRNIRRPTRWLAPTHRLLVLPGRSKDPASPIAHAGLTGEAARDVDALAREVERLEAAERRARLRV